MRETSIYFTSLEPQPVPTTSQLLQGPGLPWTLRVSLPWPETAAGTWEAGYSSTVSGTGSVVR